MTDLIPFAYDDQEVRSLLIDDNPWFVVQDVAAVLGIQNARQVVTGFNEADVSTTDISSGGQRRAFSIVNESGLYELIFQSRKPGAKAFRRWVTGTVLPAIRKTGSYSTVSPAEQMALGLQAAQILLTQRDQTIAELTPKADFYDHVIDTTGLYSMEAAAKALGYGRNVLYRTLRRLGVLRGNNLPYQRYLHHFEVKVGTYTNRAGDLVPTMTTYVRPAGLDFLRRKLAQAEAAVLVPA